MRVEVQPLEVIHCHDAARLHMQCLPTPFRGLAGVKILEYTYRCLAEGSGGYGYVASEGGRILGYGCGIWQPGMVKRQLFVKYWPILAFWCLMHLVVLPQTWKGLARRFLESFTRSQVVDGYEFRPLVVVPEARGSGVASLLVARILEDAGQRGFDKVHLVTEADNHPANAFFRKIGFIATGETERSGRKYLVYEYRLQ